MHTFYMQNQTSIRISTELLNTLKKFKEESDSYENVIWDFIEPHLELSDKTKEDIKKSVEENNSWTKEKCEKQLKKIDKGFLVTKIGKRENFYLVLI